MYEYYLLRWWAEAETLELGNNTYHDRGDLAPPPSILAADDDEVDIFKFFIQHRLFF